MCDQDTGQDRFYFFQSNGLEEDRIEPGLHCQGFVPLVGMAGDGDDSCLGEGRDLAKALHETTAVQVRHRQIDEHQIGPKCGRNVERLRPAIGHMHLVAEFFNQQTQGVCTVSVVINDENPKSLLGRRHRLLYFASVHGFGYAESHTIIAAIRGHQVAFSETVAKICCTFLKRSRLDQMVIEPGVLRTLAV